MISITFRKRKVYFTKALCVYKKCQFLVTKCKIWCSTRFYIICPKLIILYNNVIFHYFHHFFTLYYLLIIQMHFALVILYMKKCLILHASWINLILNENHKISLLKYFMTNYLLQTNKTMHRCLCKITNLKVLCIKNWDSVHNKVYL